MKAYTINRDSGISGTAPDVHQCISHVCAVCKVSTWLPGLIGFVVDTFVVEMFEREIVGKKRGASCRRLDVHPCISHLVAFCKPILAMFLQRRTSMQSACLCFVNHSLQSLHRSHDCSLACWLCFVSTSLQYLLARMLVR